MKLVSTMLFASLLLSDYVHCDSFNLDFEQQKDNAPTLWKSYNVDKSSSSTDTLIFNSGSYSLYIKNLSDKPRSQNWQLRLPASYQGEKIVLSGYIKTEGVKNGNAGFAMSVSPSIAFDAMQGREITGTTDWKKYEINLDLKPQQAEEITVSAYLTGTGKVWVDNLHLSIDGISIDAAPLKAFKSADKDREFDNGSDIEVGIKSNQELENLEILGKVWGFIKYHHPGVAKGNYNWDYELLRFLPNYQKVVTSSERDLTLFKWIEGLGNVELCQQCTPTASDAFLKPDLEWMNTLKLSVKLKQQLLFIYENRHQGTHYYIEVAKEVGNPIFNHEKSYANLPYPDDGFRLLSVYRYWNIIHYYFPNKHLIDNDWRGVMRKHIPSFINANNELEYEIAVLKLIAEVQDTHANIRGGHNALYNWRGQYRPPVAVNFIENKLIVTEFFNPDLQQETGLRIGDEITEIEDVMIADVVNQQLPYTPASNYSRQLFDISKKLLRSNNKSIKISYVSNGKESTKLLSLYTWKELNMKAYYNAKSSVPSIEKWDNNIGYVNLISIKKSDIKRIEQEMQDTKGIIVDLRNYPNTFVTYQLAELFTKEATPWVMFSTLNLNNPGEFNLMPAVNTAGNDNYYRGKVVILVNENTLSQAEFTAMALRAGGNATVIGSTTAGADGDVSIFYLPGGIKTGISGLGVYYPDGSETQRIGIVPDIKVSPTVASIKSGRDELIEAALKLMKM
ncbi:hypothetical protein JK628_04195 [Shewanella sp. KX20019]|uniref:S41 family peptidase n=1 Tax=Shewanella sp. KX20019 TaxID=2803864 RepID=UPI0019297A96|nr:S41 family peptidase [Shewanella sp. KX20019]QQX81081.1 hypothetical protein JK628_04195 [Shewanella sp. KX20019]